MNAVWLNDGLLAAPATVAGLRSRWWAGDPEFGRNPEYRKMNWSISVVWTSGQAEGVWWGERVGFEDPIDAARDRLKPAMEAEMARLSELLWPSEEPSTMRQCGSMSNAGMRCRLTYGHEPPHVDDNDYYWMLSDHI